MRRRDPRRRPRLIRIAALALLFLVVWRPALRNPALAQPPVELELPDGVADAPSGADGDEDAAFFTDDCDADCAANWTATSPGDVTKVLVSYWPASGGKQPGCAQALWAVTPADTILRFDRAIPPSMALDELTMSIAAFTPHQCAAVLRVRFPKAIDPNTGLPTIAWVAGTPSPRAVSTEWRTLTAGTTEAALNSARRRVRLTLSPDTAEGDDAADLTGAVVDRAGLLLWTDGGNAGRAAVRVDDLRVGPLVRLEQSDDPEVIGLINLPEPERRLKVEGGRITLDDEPLFPRLTLDYGVDPLVLAGSGFNLVQVPDWRRDDLLARIAAVGLGAAAEPPLPGQAGAGPADLNQPAEETLAPFGPSTGPIWLWNFRPRLDSDTGTIARMTAWADAVRNADVDRDRPILMDVVGSERAYSRIADLLGVSRMVLGTALPLWEHTALIREVADRKARPGEPLFTWLQSAPHRRTAEMRAAAGLAPAILEPELISRQALGAVAGGVKGVGYWLTEPLDDATPARIERRLAMKLANLQLAAVEPILASATKTAPLRVVPATTGDPRAANRTRRGFGQRTNLLRGQLIGNSATRGVGVGGSQGFGIFANARTTDPTDPAVGETGALDASPAGFATGAVLSDGADRLIVAVWHGADDQFVPGPAPFTSATFTVPGALPTAAAYRIRPTAIEVLPFEQVTGGMRVTVPNFGEGATVLVTPNPRGVEHLRRRVKKLAPGAATAAVQLARLKFERTRDVDARLRPRRSRDRFFLQLDAELRVAQEKLRDAEQMLQQYDWDRAWNASVIARRATRRVQRAHWDRLVDESGLTGIPNASPHLIAFSTLPDHVALMQQLAYAGRGQAVAMLPDESSLRSAALPLMSEEERAALGPDAASDPAPFDGPVYYGAPESVNAAAVLNNGELRLTAQTKRGYDPPTLLERGQVVVQTEPFFVPRGHAAIIRGELNVDGRVTGNGEGVTVHDTWAGELGGLRWVGDEPAFDDEENDGWVPFILIRPLPPAPTRRPLPRQDGTRPIAVTFSLHGLGSARFRQITIETVPLASASQPPPAPTEPAPAPMPRLLKRLGDALKRF
ncbi:MAG: hypothetical protein AAF907_01620 [Planctomycetota bacterium]